MNAREDDIFKALSSNTRMEMVKLLLNREYHVSGLAKALGISVPVAAKHVKILERAGLVKNEVFGKTHVLRVDKERLYESLEAFSEEQEIEVKKGTSLLDVLKSVTGVGLRKIGDREFIVSIDGEEGFYIYEVNGRLPDKSITEYKLRNNKEIEIKKLVPVLKKRLKVTVRK